MFQIPMKVEKTIEVSKPPREVFDYIADFSNWPVWSPWLCQERSCPVTLEGTAGKAGHGQFWDGKVIGSGEMKIRDLTAPHAIHYDLAFLKPWKSKSQVDFELGEHDGHTRITWNMDGSLPFFLFFLKKTMETLVGGDYERGLKMLKTALETGQVPSRIEEKGIEERAGFHWVGNKRACTIEEMPALMKSDLDTLAQKLQSGKLPPPKFVFSMYHKWDFNHGRCQYTTAYAYDEAVQSPDFEHGSVPPHDAFRVNHVGSYDFLGNAYGAITAHQRAEGLKANKKIGMYEIYESDPATTPEKDRVTAIFLPLR